MLFIMISFSCLALSAQTEAHCEYAEVLVIERLTNGKTEIKGISLNSMSQEAALDEAEINDIKSIAQLLWAMDSKGWSL